MESIKMPKIDGLVPNCRKQHHRIDRDSSTAELSARTPSIEVRILVLQPAESPGAVVLPFGRSLERMHGSTPNAGLLGTRCGRPMPLRHYVRKFAHEDVAMSTNPVADKEATV